MQAVIAHDSVALMSIAREEMGNIHSSLTQVNALR